MLQFIKLYQHQQQLVLILAHFTPPDDGVFLAKSFELVSLLFIGVQNCILPPGVDESCSLLRSYTTSSGNFIPTFWDNIEDGADSLYRMSVRYCLYSLRNNPEDSSSCLSLFYVLHLVAIINEYMGRVAQSV